MTWVIKHNGMEFSSDDFLIDDLAEIEKVTETPWSVSNPLRSIPTARAFLAAAMLRSGKSHAEVEITLKHITLKSLKRSFEFVPDQDDDDTEEESPDPLDSPSPSSSGGARRTAGRRPKSESNVSAIA